MARSPPVRASYIAISYIIKPSLAHSVRYSSSSRFRRADFMNQPFTGAYEPGQPTNGPLDDASALGVPPVTPKTLKDHLDQYIVGQDRAKRIISVAVFNHYQRIRELRRQEDERQQLLKQRLRAQKRDARSHEGDHFPVASPSACPRD